MSFPRLSLSPTEVDARRRSSRLVGSVAAGRAKSHAEFGLSTKMAPWEDSESEPESEPVEAPAALAQPRPSQAPLQAPSKSKPIVAKPPPPALPSAASVPKALSATAAGAGSKPAKSKATAATVAESKSKTHPEPSDMIVKCFRASYGKRASEQPRAPLQLRATSLKAIARRSPKQQPAHDATGTRLSRASDRRQPVAQQASAAAPHVAAKTTRATASTRHPRQASLRQIDYREEDSDHDKSTSDIESVDFDLSIPVRRSVKRGSSDRDSASDSDTIATAAASSRRVSKRSRVAKVPEEEDDDDDDDDSVVMTNVLESAKEYWAEIDSIPTEEFEVIAKEDKWKYF
jgi:hypothetical protein